MAFGQAGPLRAVPPGTAAPREVVMVVQDEEELLAVVLGLRSCGEHFGGNASHRWIVFRCSDWKSTAVRSLQIAT